MAVESVTARVVVAGDPSSVAVTRIKNPRVGSGFQDHFELNHLLAHFEDGFVVDVLDGVLQRPGWEWEAWSCKIWWGKMCRRDGRDEFMEGTRQARKRRVPASLRGPDVAMFRCGEVHPNFVTLSHHSHSVRIFPDYWIWLGYPRLGSARVQESSLSLDQKLSSGKKRATCLKVFGNSCKAYGPTWLTIKGY
ncbi:hypothetical protein B0H12DRAFT_1070945 [Mycena haematopus]|nr:hypothetical protein B0H12DRAFT_1070945 [Mycena haematopus]